MTGTGTGTGTARPARGRPGSGGRRPTRPPLVPHQHGAWAFLALPVVLAAPHLAWHPALAALVVAWVAAYPFSWAVTGILTARPPERFLRAAVLWGALAVPAAATGLVWRPWLAWVGAAFLGGFAVSLRYARVRDERALGNDLVVVAQCSLMVPVLAATSGGGWLPPAPSVPADIWLLTLACFAALAGSTLHVKSLIRERRDPRYARASRAFALASLLAVVVAAAAGATGGWLVVAFLALAVRAFAVSDPTWRPARIGLVELALLVLLAVCAGVA